MRHNKEQDPSSPLAAWCDRLDFLSLLDTLPHGLLLLDGQRRTQWLNRYLEALLGYSRDEAVGVRGEYLLRSSLLKEGDPVGAVLTTGETGIMDGDIVNQARKLVPVRFTITPLPSRLGERAGIAIIVEDISLLKALDDKVQGITGQGGIIGHSARMEEIFDLLPIAARTDASALITGETGTGKDLIAEAIHKISRRARNPFIKVNCGAIPEALLESELFGHSRGAFTGADRDKPGMFRLAHNGTIFLTEIGDLPLSLQVKLLTVLDDKEFFPVGGDKKVKVDVRVIAATHRDLASLVREGRFREDLYYRLNVLRLHVPPLRERADDIMLLIDHFLKDFAKGLNKNIKGCSRQCLSLLSSYPYPGNVRELKNIVEYAVNLCQGDIVEADHLPRSMLDQPALSPTLPTMPAGRSCAIPGDSDTTSVRSTAAVIVPATLTGNSSMVPAEEASLATALQGWGEKEREIIMEALVKTKGRRSLAAELLGWSRSTLWRKIRHHGLE